MAHRRKAQGTRSSVAPVAHPSAAAEARRKRLAAMRQYEIKAAGLTQAGIGADLDLHESVISRVVNDRYEGDVAPDVVDRVKRYISQHTRRPISYLWPDTPAARPAPASPAPAVATEDSASQ